MGLGHGADIVRNGLVLHLDAANVKSYPGTGTVCTSIESLKSIGALTNGATFNNINKGSFTFDGSNDRIMLPRISPQGESLNWTISAWVKYSDIGYNSWMIVVDQANYSLVQNYMMWLNSDSPSTGKLLATYDGGWQYGTIRMFPNIWYNVTLTRATNTVKFYLNGNFDVQRTYNNTIANATGEIGIGGHPNNSAYSFNGYISLVTIYNTVLSDLEIRQNFEAIRGRYGI